MTRTIVSIFFLAFACLITEAAQTRKYRMVFRQSLTRTNSWCVDKVPDKYHRLYTSNYCEIVAERIVNVTRRDGISVELATEEECNRAPVIPCWCRKTCGSCRGFDIIDSKKVPCTELSTHDRLEQSGERKTGCQIYRALREYCPETCNSPTELTCDGLGVPQPIDA